MLLVYLYSRDVGSTYLFLCLLSGFTVAKIEFAV